MLTYYFWERSRGGRVTGRVIAAGRRVDERLI